MDNYIIERKKELTEELKPLNLNLFELKHTRRMIKYDSDDKKYNKKVSSIVSKIEKVEKDIHIAKFNYAIDIKNKRNEIKEAGAEAIAEKREARAEAIAEKREAEKAEKVKKTESIIKMRCDSTHNFIKNHCKKTNDRKQSIKTLDLYNLYTTFCSRNKMISASRRQFYKILVDEYTYDIYKNNNRRCLCICTYNNQLHEHKQSLINNIKEYAVK